MFIWFLLNNIYVFESSNEEPQSNHVLMIRKWFKRIHEMISRNVLIFISRNFTYGLKKKKCFAFYVTNKGYNLKFRNRVTCKDFQFSIYHDLKNYLKYRVPAKYISFWKCFKKLLNISSNFFFDLKVPYFRLVKNSGK